MEHYTIRSCMYSPSEMWVVRDVYDKPVRNFGFLDETKELWPKLLRVDWLTPDGWTPGVEGGYPPLFNPSELVTLFVEALVGE